MTTVIKDGTGTGNTAKVSDSNQLSTFAEIIAEATVASLDGNAYNLNTGSITLTTSTKSAVFYFKNTSQDETLSVNAFFFLLGNSTGGVGDVLISLIRNPTAGTIVSNAVDMEMAGVNRNFGSNQSLQADIFKGVEGDTLTGGEKVIESILDQSPANITLAAGAILLPPGTSIGIDVTPATGNTSFSCEFAANVFVRSEK